MASEFEHAIVRDDRIVYAASRAEFVRSTPASSTGIARSSTNAAQPTPLEGFALGSVALPDDLALQGCPPREPRDSLEPTQLLRAIVGAEEAERKRIAADLHDGFGQILGSLKLGVESALAALPSQGNGVARDVLVSMLPRIREAMDEVRRIAMNLRPSTLDDLGLVATLGWLTREFQALHPQVSVETRILAAEQDVPDTLKVVIYRVVQEALNNVAKHAHARNVGITLVRMTDVLRLVVEDDGVGFRPGGDRNGTRGISRCGHAGMRDRVELSGGTFGLQSAPSHGVRLAMEWTCPSPHANAISSVGRPRAADVLAPSVAARSA